MKAESFIYRLEMAQDIQRESEAIGLPLSLMESYRAWWEYSNDRCASWLVRDGSAGTSELRLAVRIYHAKREKH